MQLPAILSYAIKSNQEHKTNNDHTTCNFMTVVIWDIYIKNISGLHQPSLMFICEFGMIVSDCFRYYLYGYLINLSVRSKDNSPCSRPVFCVYYPRQTCEIYQVLPHSFVFKALGQLWNPLSKTVLIKCSFISNKGYVNIWNYCKVQK